MSKNPEEDIKLWRDEIPILMFPVRLETRFRTDGDRRQLWVRIYPDDCSIDTFEERLSESEVESAKAYWGAVWAAGGIESERRGAWRVLAGGYGAGRAEWIVRTYQPLHPGDAPSKPAAQDVVLVIVTEEPPSEPARSALLAYWRELWRAGDDGGRARAAYDALASAVDSKETADALIKDYAPFNIGVKPVAPATRDSVSVEAAFLAVPKAKDLDVKSRSWSRAATAELLPDRFVFIAFRGGGQEIFQVGEPVLSPLPVSPDPTAPKERQIRQDETTGELLFPDELLWMTDFERAVAAGLGFRIDLNVDQAEVGLERVLVLGLRFSSDETKAQQELETLLTHHRFSRGGLEIVPQGTPTNNTDDGDSGHSRDEDPDESFDELDAASFFESTNAWAEKRDGQWLGEYLGIDPSVLGRVRNSGGLDQSDARAMNAALWPATLGYWMESMMEPVFTADAVDRTRDFFVRSVLGRGAVPALRIGNQPYGILPATAFSRMQWMRSAPDDPSSGYLDNLYGVLRLMDEDWQTMVQYVAYAGKPGDAHQLLLDIVGLHSGSVEFSQRYAESLEQLFNRLKLEGLGGFISALIVAALRQRAMDLLARFGSTPNPDPEMVRKVFLRAHNPLKGPLIDDRPLSESEAIRAYTDDGANYLQWLADAARRSLDAVYAQEGFLEDKPPQALLYLMLRHALQLGFHDTGVRLYRERGLMTAAEATVAKRDDSFIHIRQQAPPHESRYGILYAPQAVITGSPTLSIGEYIATQSPTLSAAQALEEQIRAIERLQGASTARLERAFAEHIDCCAYRLDAWLLGLVQEQLARMRGLKDTTKETDPPRRGIYLGAYAWLEDLRPEQRTLSPAEIKDPDVAKDFDEPGAEPLLADTANQGYIHAPSLNHAVAAAVLRNGYITNAGQANAQTLAVNLTSERVRIALGILEGIRGGQSLGALLGYQFERGLHDRYTFGVELDQFIYKLRREFPLQSNRLASTQVDDDDLAIADIEARNVIDGLALVNHMRATGSATYKFGKSRLPNATPAQAAAINAEAARLIETYDALADLALSEGVYQAVLGNYDRVASTLDAYSKGNFPPEPQIVRTPFEGVGITHRVALHFEAGLDATVSPVTGIAPTPRALAEPAVNRWLASLLPPLGEIGCVVRYHDAASGVPATRNVTLRDLALQPADLLGLLREDRDESSLTELDERITRLVSADARPDLPVEIRYMEPGTADFSLFEVTPLVRYLRRLLQGARPLQPTDLTLSNEAKRADDGTVSIDRQRIVLVRQALDGVLADLGVFIADLEAPLADPNRRDEVIDGVDGFADRITALLARAAAFGIPQSGWGFVYDFRAAVFSAVTTKARDLINGWTVRLGQYDALRAEYDALPGTATHEEKLRLLMKAEAAISTTTVNPVPADPDDYRDALDGKRALFEAKRDDFLSIRDTTRSEVALLLADAAAPLPIDEFEFPATSFVSEENAAVRFAEDALRVAQVIEREAKRRRDGATARIAEHDAAASPVARVAALTAAAKLLLGEDFTIVPELRLAPDRAAEVTSASAASASLLDYLTGTVGTPEPVDTWLYGVARVRERMRHWEQVVMLAGAFDRPEPELTPLQLPFLSNDRWLALEFPPDADLQTDKLLYTAHFSAAFDAGAPQCGLLLDEWTEVIPSAQTTTGLAFHYDRPNSEAPQAMLLVTPPVFRGSWQWADLVDALNQTLDLAKRRAVEPVHVDSGAYAQFLPATVMAVTISQLTISANLALNNDLAQWVRAND